MRRPQMPVSDLRETVIDCLREALVYAIAASAFTALCVGLAWATFKLLVW